MEESKCYAYQLNKRANGPYLFDKMLFSNKKQAIVGACSSMNCRKNQLQCWKNQKPKAKYLEK